jgi:methionyl-tRNA formyltransferase
MSAAPLTLVFMGSDPIARPMLNWLTGEGSGVARVTAVFTQPDRAVGRGQKVTANAIKQWALERALPVFQPEKLTAEVRGQLGALGADVALVMAYGHILRDDFIATPLLGTLNLHVSLLPKYRGASPIQAAIASGETETGVSLMRIVRQLDAGPVADIERVPIASLDTAEEVEAKLAAASVPLIARALPRLRDGALTFCPQDDAAATYCRRLEKADGTLDFSAPARTLAARVNGLFPWPGCAIVVQEQTVKLGLADTLDEPQVEQHAPGEVLGADAEGLLVATGEGVLRLRRLQRPGGKMLAAAEFLRGWPVKTGIVLPSQPMSQLVKP